MPKLDLRKILRVKPGTALKLKNLDPGWAQVDDLKTLGKTEVKARARELLAANLAELAEAQDRLYSSAVHAILIVIQAMDAAGKDGTIKHVMSGVNPQGCEVTSFKQPSAEELRHDFLWRSSRVLPERGRIGIFNRSYYEEVLVARVHPEILARQALPPGKRGQSFWERRFEDINNFEQHLERNGTVVLKFFLNISKAEQKRRLLARLDDPAKHWKFSAADLAERALWDQYMNAYEDAISATSTDHAPWYVIPSDHKWAARAAVAEILTATIRDLDVTYPKLAPEQEAALADARKRLEAE